MSFCATIGSMVEHRITMNWRPLPEQSGLVGWELMIGVAASADSDFWKVAVRNGERQKAFGVDLPHADSAIERARNETTALKALWPEIEKWALMDGGTQV